MPLAAFVLLTVEYSILMTWVYLHTSGSVLLATLFHGAINLSQGLFLGAVDGATRYWLFSIVYGIAASSWLGAWHGNRSESSTERKTNHVSEESTTS